MGWYFTDTITSTFGYVITLDRASELSNYLGTQTDVGLLFAYIASILLAAMLVRLIKSI